MPAAVSPIITKIECGPYHIAALRSDNTVVSWGSKAIEFTPEESSGAADVVCGTNFTAIRKTSGAVVLRPPFSGNARKVILLDESKYRAEKICAGANYLAGLSAGRIETFGPVFNAAPKGVVFSDVFCGPQYVIGLDAGSGRLYTWGQKSVAVIPVVPVELDNIVFACGNNNAVVAIKADKSLVSFNNKVLLGAPGGDFVHVSCADNYFVGIRSDLSLVAWSPGMPAGAPAGMPPGLLAKYVCTSPTYTLAITLQNRVVGWGRAHFGELDIPAEYAVHAAFSSVKEMEPPVLILNLEGVGNAVGIQPIQNVFDIQGHNDMPVIDFLMQYQGNACIFETGGVQTGTTKSLLKDEIESGSSIFYECVERKVYQPPKFNGRFGPSNVINRPYVKIAINGTFYVPLEDAIKIFGAHQFWQVVPTQVILQYTCGRDSAIAGGPVVGGDHCQDGTEKRVHRLVPYVFDAKAPVAAANAAEPVENVIKVQYTGGTIKIPIAGATATVTKIKSEFAKKVGKTTDKIRFLYLGHEPTGPTKIPSGGIIQAQISAEGGKRATRRARK